jgi:hypothetical protein
LRDFTYRTHSEKNVDGFTALDGTVRFYNFVKAAMLAVGAREVFDFGAGRGGFWHDDPSAYRRELRDLRSAGAWVDGAKFRFGSEKTAATGATKMIAATAYKEESEPTEI